MKGAASALGLNTNVLAVGLSLVAWDARLPLEGAGEVISFMSCVADSGTGTAGAFRLAGLNGGISGIFITIFFGGAGLGASDFTEFRITGDLAGESFAMDNLRSFAA